MSDSEPSYPKDAPIGGSDKSEPGSPAAKSPDPRRNKQLRTGAAIGIGSAAIVAALLYANRGKRGSERP
jgi:hypothetical protein